MERENVGIEERRSGPPEMVPFEHNIEESYLFAGGVAKGSRGVREYKREVKLPDGTVGIRRERYTPSEELGDLKDFDRDVYVALAFLAQMRGGMPANGKLRFSLYDVIKILNLPDNGKNFRAVRDSIVRQQKLLIDADVYSKESESYEAEHFTVWRVHFKANKGKYGRAAEHHTLTFDEVMVKSHQAGYIKQMDVNFYFSLDQKYARALYGRIDVERGEGLRWEASLSDLAMLLSLPESYKSPSQKRRALERPHDELMGKRFLRSVSFPEKDLVVYEVAEEFVAQRSEPQRWRTVEENASERTLIRNGVWANVARDLVDRRGHEVCNFYVEALPYQKGVRNKGAWLSKYISEKLPLPIEPPQRRLHQAGVGAGYDAAHLARAYDNDHPASSRASSPAAAPSPDPEAQRVWEKILEGLAAEINTPTLRVWFEGAVPTNLRDRALTLSVPNDLAREYIEGRFKPMLEEALASSLDSEEATLVLEVAGAGYANREAPD